MRRDSNATYIPPSVRLMYPTNGVLHSVRDDDPVMAVQESYGPSAREVNGERYYDGPDHRYQVMLMPVGDTLSAFWTDLGPAEEFRMEVAGESYRVPPYFQLILMEHTVAECRYMADHNRQDDYAVRLLHEQVNESDLFERYARLIEEDMYLVKNRSTFGAGGFTQRNGYSALAAREQRERITHGY